MDGLEKVVIPEQSNQPIPYLINDKTTLILNLNKETLEKDYLCGTPSFVHMMNFSFMTNPEDPNKSRKVGLSRTNNGSGNTGNTVLVNG